MVQEVSRSQHEHKSIIVCNIAQQTNVISEVAVGDGAFCLFERLPAFAHVPLVSVSVERRVEQNLLGSGKGEVVVSFSVAGWRELEVVI